MTATKEETDVNAQHSEPGVLIVDDSRTNIHVLGTFLRKHHFSVRSARDGRAALSVAQTQAPDLILLDIMLPDLDGYDVCSLLKVDERTSEIPVIFISSLDAVFDKLKGFSVGGVDYITKPFHEEEVVGKNPRILKSGKQGPELFRELWETLSRGEVWKGEFINSAHEDRAV